MCRRNRDAMDLYRRALLNSFVLSNVDRCTERRDDARWLAQCKRDAASLFVAVRDGECLVDIDGAPIFLDAARAAALETEAVFLGCMDAAAVFVVDCEVGVAAESEGERFVDLRAAAKQMNAEHASLLAYAKSIAHWRRHHRRCPACGAQTRSESGGHVLRCEDCKRAHFPRTDPAVIVLVEHADACLLGRQPGWEARRYSVLAGFVEPGESAEQAVAREVHEEAGLAITALRYHASQPWPFPNSLMLGYFAEARDAAIHIDRDELEDAQWFTRDELTRALHKKEISLSTPISISYRLIEHWFDAGSETPLRDVLARCKS